MSQQNIEYGIAQSTKEKMKLKDDPNRPKGAVRNSSSDLSVFTSKDKKFVEIVDEYLINKNGGIKLKCRPALKDLTGGYGAFYLFPGEKNENSNTST